MTYRTRIKYTAAHDCMDLGTPLRGVQEVERIRTNIGHIRVKMSGTNFPDRVEESCRHDPVSTTD